MSAAPIFMGICLMAASVANAEVGCHKKDGKWICEKDTPHDASGSAPGNGPKSGNGTAGHNNLPAPEAAKRDRLGPNSSVADAMLERKAADRIEKLEPKGSITDAETRFLDKNGLEKRLDRRRAIQNLDMGRVTH